MVNGDVMPVKLQEDYKKENKESKENKEKED